MSFRLADMDVRWSGVDDTTPVGYCLASGLDPFGQVTVWLFTGDTPTDDTYRGRLLVREDGPALAYGPGGGYVRSGFDHTELLAAIAARPNTTEETQR